MKAITTRVLPWTEHKPTRIKAEDRDGNSVTVTVTVTAPPADFFAHRAAAEALCAKMKWRHADSLVGGETKHGYAWVFTQDNDPIQRRRITTGGGHTLDFFYNRENNLLVVDLKHSVRRGGNELVRRTLDERALLKHCKLPKWSDPEED